MTAREVAAQSLLQLVSHMLFILKFKKYEIEDIIKQAGIEEFQ